MRNRITLGLYGSIKFIKVYIYHLKDNLFLIYSVNIRLIMIINESEHNLCKLLSVG
jgi:hypothetical protein